MNGTLGIDYQELHKLGQATSLIFSFLVSDMNVYDHLLAPFLPLNSSERQNYVLNEF